MAGGIPRKKKVVRIKKARAASRGTVTLVPKPKNEPALVESGPAYFCMWCYTPKDVMKAKCASCGHFGSTTYPMSWESHIYVEDVEDAS